MKTSDKNCKEEILELLRSTQRDGEKLKTFVGFNYIF